MENTASTLRVNHILYGTAYTYHIEKVLGQGSFGITYLATTKVKISGPLGEIETDIKVAVKEFFMKEFSSRHEDGTITEMTCGSLVQNYSKKFRKEAENLAKLSHPNIVNVLEVFDANNTCYYSMQYIPGGSLDEYVRKRGGLPEKEAIACIRQIGAAVQYMHDHKMLHLDLKPSNVMRSEDGKKMVLIDFGLSKQYEVNGMPETSTTIGLGTPGYAPIEQSSADRDKEFAPTLDVYALGATMYKIISGERPPSSTDVLNDGLDVELLEASGASSETITVISGAMEVTRKRRIQSISSFLDMLPDVLDSPSEQGYYSKYEGSHDYGLTKVRYPVLDPLPMPDSQVYISSETKDGSGYSFELRLNAWTCNTLIVRHRGRIVIDDELSSGINDDVKKYLSLNGFLSKVHWEKEEHTLALDVAGDYIIEIKFIYRDGTTFVRKVNPANFKWHSLLIEEVNALLCNTSLSALFPSDILKNLFGQEKYQRGNMLETTLIVEPMLKAIGGHDYVDLGLPSGLLWATCNVGASRPSEFGSYYSWGETATKNIYNWSNLKYCNDSKGDSFSKYNRDKAGTKDNKMRLEMSDDAARANWGGSWRMPTVDEWKELQNNCTWTWTSQGGHNGYKVTGKNGNSIFLPAAGWRGGESLYDAGESGDYWSSSLGTDGSHGIVRSYEAYLCYFSSGNVYPSDWDDRCDGRSVRPVSSSTPQ